MDGSGGSGGKLARHLTLIRTGAAGAVVVALIAAVALTLSEGLGHRPGDGPGATLWQPPSAEAPPSARDGACEYPAQVLDLTGWKVTMPTGSDEKPKEVEQPELATFDETPWFQPTQGCQGVAFRAPVNGITTSGSHYPRSELREMGPDGEPASWSSDSGTHTFVVDEAFTALPQGRPNLVGAQIHDDSDDVSVFRLEGSDLYITKGSDPHYKLVTGDYVLGTRFEAKFVVHDDTVRAYYNGTLQATFPASFSDAYFKAGAYTQANCEEDGVPCSSSNYGETTIYRLAVNHS
ncbi:MAG TPA: polysaccharide lyase family 7 protein [Pseudonocardia sp.]|jgi:hypothetical protein|nr:polysaccharide lyase family 7 protein [Pseudonocardia sp.]